MLSCAFKFITLFVLMIPAVASSQGLISELNEEVFQISKKGRFFTAQLETTLYKPTTGGPFPVVVINHGKSPGDTRFQSRYRPTSAARFFLQRGYAVVVPMRQGFSKSEGTYIGGGCNVESNGNVQAEDVKAVLDFVVQQPWAKKDQILVVGQSHGGWVTLAFGQQNYPGVRGLINFAGGLRQESCVGWESGLIRAAGDYGGNTRSPSLWFYGDNDSYFSPFIYNDMFEKYTSAGGLAELVAFGVLGSDAHTMFGSRGGEVIWQPKVQEFMQKLGLPVNINHPEFASTPQMPMPLVTNFADVRDESAIPFIGEKGRDGYRKFLTKQYPRAFVVSSSGRWAWAEMGDDPLKRALDTCHKNNENECFPYAVNDQVVWKKD